ncbi:DUF4340 domain-containing protein [Chloroflexota bacterium]
MRIRNILILLAILLALSGYFLFFNNSEPPPEIKPKIYVWDVDLDEIQHIEIRLPHENMSESFIKIAKESEFPWFFDDPQRSALDTTRWGGITLILSGPGADRVITRNTTGEKLTEFGLTQPQMEIILTLENENILSIKVGDRTPDGDTYYVQAPGTNDVALVDYTWYEVLERLVKEPPYTSPSTN